MEVIRTKSELKSILQRRRKEQSRIGFVPTMGYLHSGHTSLINEAAAVSDVTVVSIFVNPLQFGEGEDFTTYPRDEDHDQREARKAGADILFLPSPEEMYPSPMRFNLHVQEGADVLCGASRPGHFDGVATVVMKLFQLVTPDAAFFGQKDAQQAALITNMVEDFDIDTRIHVIPTIREEDGLAESSRNVRLLPEEREEAPQIYRILNEGASLAEKDGPWTAESWMQDAFQALSGELDYAEIRSYPSLKREQDRTMIAAAALKYKHVRLIDNVIWNTDQRRETE
ncbi:pantoate--beta-alanine ligase [Alkalicoccus chagannorensis]|uniref:pantoate--beta-alanine ligase n=1 Tax=Alkalicoccus chagannorensis TaxID=427072 RepID=UPI00040FB7E5|nr:pantoate--beta-alanine ligase [Alkalicoccus chagannorensis]